MVDVKVPAQSVHRKRWTEEPIRIVGKVRGRGRKPEGPCYTIQFTEGDVKLRRGIFRKLKNIVIEKYADLIKLASYN